MGFNAQFKRSAQQVSASEFVVGDYVETPAGLMYLTEVERDGDRVVFPGIGHFAADEMLWRISYK